ncbi:pseudaminic acid cytidylyltransferase [Chitinophaga agrisoli]|uniref:Pseudaminic acid cytidylyltransferase n=1 Tax=Chitinophaga agrisoli TaxID=2607653 RepID=A0A5B2W2N1_9BACT|nr:pseudaminic acid cytidylyltransferase [Chitinophaga agrisoli]KAA2245344.1 pseudaminic acid cytidylyltransferase [Chitinophaga agrisoli]
MKNLAIIPARGGSKRIPRKNIKPFLDKPIISYSIQAALDTGLFDEVMVSTDDPEIAAVAQACGAQVPFFRSGQNSNDFATLTDVILEVVAAYEAKQQGPENICCILATAPFITASRLKEAYDKMLNEQLTSVFPVVKFSYPIQRALKVDPVTGLVSMLYPEHLTTRSQDLEEYYHDSGQFYWAKPDALRSEQTLFTARAGMLALSQTEVQDIDSEDDWLMAEQKFRLMNLYKGA